LCSSLDLPREVVTVELKPVAQICQMRQVTAVAGVEMHRIAPQPSRLLLDVSQECAAESGLVARGEGDQIIDVKHVSPGQGVEKPVARDCGHGVFMLRNFSIKWLQHNHFDFSVYDYRRLE
jgi:hypothetical protein